DAAAEVIVIEPGRVLRRVDRLREGSDGRIIVALLECCVAGILVGGALALRNRRRRRRRLHYDGRYRSRRRRKAREINAVLDEEQTSCAGSLPFAVEHLFTEDHRLAVGG